jgi:RNA polymerase sigma-70 factor (ECF subfamily)
VAEVQQSVAEKVNRDNETWLVHLEEGNPNQQLALSDLRLSLLRGLAGALSSRSYVNESFLEDAVQEALILILTRIEQFEGRSQFMTWATSIAIRVAMSKLRRKQWKELSLDAEIKAGHFEFEDIDETNSNPEFHWTRSSVLQKLYTVIENELTEKQRIALLAELKGMPQDEIAKQLNSNRNAVYKLTHDARKRLKNGLELAGFEIADIYSAFTN